MTSSPQASTTDAIPAAIPSPAIDAKRQEDNNSQAHNPLPHKRHSTDTSSTTAKGASKFRVADTPAEAVSRIMRGKADQCIPEESQVPGSSELPNVLFTASSPHNAPQAVHCPAVKDDEHARPAPVALVRSASEGTLTLPLVGMDAS